MSADTGAQGELVDFAAATSRAGFRLQRLQMLNWGTFHGKVWSLDLGGDTSLLTGDIGSGKSTVVDAITTLLVAPKNIAYNKAAGAEARERSLRSYFFGYYKAERSEMGLGAKPVSLRGPHDYSVLLANFYNSALGQHVTVAQAFWMRTTEGQPDRVYIVADQRLSIPEHFSKVTEIPELRRRMRKLTSDVDETFAKYQTAFRRRLCINGDQALELFNQTVSMKSVGNLTEFVRSHMLQPFPVQERVEHLLRHFDDLTRAHDAVLRAKDQVGLLQPLVAECDQHSGLSLRVSEARICRDALEAWIASQRIEPLSGAIRAARDELQEVGTEIERASRGKNELGEKRDRVKLDIARNGGDRIEHLKSERNARRKEEVERLARAKKYDAAAKVAGLAEVTEAQTFSANAQQALRMHSRVDAELSDHRKRAVDAGISFKELAAERKTLADELDSLRTRPSNIPLEFLKLRTNLCNALGVDEDELPFAGELVGVHADEQEWEGAIERVLRPFGTSLLVPDVHYAKVSKWVDAQHLGMRLVYHRVKEGAQPLPSTGPRSLVRKLEFKHDSPLAEWVELEIMRSFNPACCDTLDEFRREREALTRNGQHKKGSKHVKDDGHRVNDRTRYVLGWANEGKRAALEVLLEKCEAAAHEVSLVMVGIEEQEKSLGASLDAIKLVTSFGSFAELDWRESAAEQVKLGQQIAELENASDVLRTLQDRLHEIEEQLVKLEAELTALNRSHSRIDERLKKRDKDLWNARRIVGAAGKEKVARFQKLEELRSEQGALPAIDIDNGADVERTFREWIQGRIDADQKKIATLGERVASAMQKYCERYSTETREVGANLGYAEEYRGMLKRLNDDDLPRFERRFKELLNENTIREIAGFQSQLKKEQREIVERIETINRSLKQIEFNSGRYILLEPAAVSDAEVRDFQQDLKACTENTLTGSGDDTYSETKFVQVKRIIERFRGRETNTDIDLKWTRKVTDVRNWFSFSASERWLEDDKEHEHYTDSGGKSGGQKEKLAYTILAASLAYQFGIGSGEGTSRSFRFVVIDEAFGRGSDDSATYALELFRKLNLQLLIVTPLQKIHVIEPFVANVGFVANSDGKDSRLRNLSIEEYREEKARRGA